MNLLSFLFHGWGHRVFRKILLAKTPHRVSSETFDTWQSITVGIYLAIVGYGVLVGIPVISTAWVSQIGFTEVEVGRLASADLGGLSIGSIFAAFLAPRFNRRWIVVCAIALTVIANILCMYTQTYDSVLFLRLLAGFGSGIYTAVSIATIGASSKPARNMNIMLFVFAFSQAFELQVLPMFSMNGIYGVFVVANLIGILMLKWLPEYPPEERETAVEEGVDDYHESVEAVRARKIAPWLCLAAIAFTYVNIGAYWTYIELAGIESPTADNEWVGSVLVWASFLSIVGCLVATVISDRFGLARPMIVTLVIHALVVGMLASGINNTNIVISLFSFNFLWIFIDVYQTATIANVDKSGRFTSLIPASQGFGQIVGPNIAASFLAVGGGYGDVFIMCAGASMMAFLVYSYMYVRLKRAIPVLADAS